MKTIFNDQFEFLEASDCTDKNLENEKLYNKLIEEEYSELNREDFYLGQPKNTNTIKEALDLMYVTAGYLNVTIGPEKAQECWEALHANNMSKCTDGKLVKNEVGKVQKPDGYEKLDLSLILGDE